MGVDSAQPSSVAVEGKQYWAKGTGFGTGSFNSKWNMKETVTKQQQEEALVTILFEVCHYHLVLHYKLFIYTLRCWENILRCWVASPMWSVSVQNCSTSVLTHVFYQPWLHTSIMTLVSSKTL